MHEQNVGRRAKFKIPSDPAEKAELLRKYGTSIEDDYRIIGVQKDYRGKVVYRLKNLSIKNDTMGRAVPGKLLKIFD